MFLFFQDFFLTEIYYMDVYSYNMISYILSNEILRFLSEIDIITVVTREITIFIFTISKNGLCMNSKLKVLPGLKGKYNLLI